VIDSGINMYDTAEGESCDILIRLGDFALASLLNLDLCIDMYEKAVSISHHLSKRERRERERERDFARVFK